VSSLWLPESSGFALHIYRSGSAPAGSNDNPTNKVHKMTTNSNDYGELTTAISKQLSTLRNDIPDVMKGFGELAKAASRDGALSRKTKELIALTLGVAAHCDACIGFHVQALVRLGTTKAELEEALGMAIYMGGGPSAMYSANALAAFEEFSAA
jgi:AhpD family alkylhydroperoxidase